MCLSPSWDQWAGQGIFSSWHQQRPRKAHKNMWFLLRPWLRTDNSHFHIDWKKTWADPNVKRPRDRGSFLLLYEEPRHVASAGIRGEGLRPVLQPSATHPRMVTVARSWHKIAEHTLISFNNNIISLRTLKTTHAYSGKNMKGGS